MSARERRDEQVRAEIDPLAAEWDALADRLEAPPFLRPGWFAAFWRAFGSGRLVVLENRRDGNLAGVLPLARNGGTLSALANYHTPLTAPLAEDAESVRELTAMALALRPRRLALSMMPAADPGVRELEAAASGQRRVVRRVQQRTPVLETEAAGDWTAYEATLSRGLRKEVRRHRRRLEELGAVRTDVVTGGDALDERLAETFELEGSGWKAERGTAILSRPETRRFYEEVARWAAGRGILRIYFLRLDEAAVAVDLTVEDAGIRYMLKGGFDVAYGRFGPGMLLLSEGLQDAFSRGVTRVEIGGGDDAYKLRWTSAVRERILLQAFAGSPAGLADHLIMARGRPAAARLLRAVRRGR